MAFITLEDLVGTVEVVVFPRDYERNAALIETDAKVFIMGKVSAEDDKASKLICEKIVSFDQVPRELWIQFADTQTVSSRRWQDSMIRCASPTAAIMWSMYLRAEQADETSSGIEKHRNRGQSAWYFTRENTARKMSKLWKRVLKNSFICIKI